MMNYQLLSHEIAAGPLADELAEKTDTEMAAILNDQRFSTVRERFITARTILAELGPEIGAGVLDKMEAASANISALKWAMRFLIGETGIDIGHAGTRSQIEAMAAGGVIATDEAAALLNMAVAPASRAEIIGLGTVTYSDVSRAISGPWEG